MEPNRLPWGDTRDMLAEKAMIGLCANATPALAPEVLAKYAYQVADAMLAERTRQHGESSWGVE